MKKATVKRYCWALWLIIAVFAVSGTVYAEDKGKSSSYSPVVIKEDFETIKDRMESAKSGIMKRHMSLIPCPYLPDNTAGLRRCFSRQSSNF